MCDHKQWPALGQALKKSQSEHNGAWPDLHAQRRWTKQARSPQMHFLPSLLFCVALVLCSCIACPLRLLDAAYLLTRSTVLLRDSLNMTLHDTLFMVPNTSALIIFACL